MAFLCVFQRCKATSSSDFLFVVAVSEHFRAGSEAISIYIYKMYHFENTGTVAEGIEEEQWDLICDIILCTEAEIAHIPLHLHRQENVFSWT